MTSTFTLQIVAREYLRVSLDESGRVRSNSEQHADNEVAADSNSWTLGESYADKGPASRQSHHKRGDFEKLLSDLEADRFGAQILIIWESSRGSRQVEEWCHLLKLCEKRGVLIHVTSHHRTYDPTVPRDRRTLLEDAVDSEYESSKLAHRVTRSMAANAAAGAPHGRTPYGYMRKYELLPNGKSRLVGQFPHPKQSRVVVRLYDGVDRGGTASGHRQGVEYRGDSGAERWAVEFHVDFRSC